MINTPIMPPASDTDPICFGNSVAAATERIEASTMKLPPVSALAPSASAQSTSAMLKAQERVIKFTLSLVSRPFFLLLLPLLVIVDTVEAMALAVLGVGSRLSMDI